MGFPKLETERLQLRELTLLDAETMFHYFSKESVIRYFGMDLSKILSKRKQRFKRLKIVMKREVYFAGE
ncbi:ribosomal-protein-alanine acetyltransferase [Bacillus anthracis str. UR-1]|nr:ribosomal-protein-alanine acetyltransferase [Bacillus anthracis str. UR-1]